MDLMLGFAVLSLILFVTGITHILGGRHWRGVRHIAFAFLSAFLSMYILHSWNQVMLRNMERGRHLPITTPATENSN
jgi:hypothetical protein